MSKTKMEKMYLDYVNNFLSLEVFAEHYQINMNTANHIYNTFHTDRPQRTIKAVK